MIDTGAIRALLDPDDKYHFQAVALFKSLGPVDYLLTTWPVITECSFAIERNRVALWQWIAVSGQGTRALLQTARADFQPLPPRRTLDAHEILRRIHAIGEKAQVAHL